MTKELLDSDRVNYLIWRYLIDSGYEETAVRLQKEWNVQDPRSLAHAPHVPNHALVSILNKGLQYSAIEREEDQAGAEGDGTAVTGYFGPLTPTSTISAAADEEDFENARKRQIDNEQPQLSNGPPSKRARLSNGNGNSNGYENGLNDAMDVDDEPPNGDENAYPSPEQLPSPVVVTTGPEQGTQIDKVHELATETVFLELSDDQASRNAVLLQCEWNPQDPKILAAAGTDALARMWILERTRTAADGDLEAQEKPLFHPHHSLLPGSASPTTNVTGLAWSGDGKSLAVASEPVDDGSAKIDFWTVEGSAFASFNIFESPIVCLRWNPSNTAFLSISPEGKGTVITIMSPTGDEPLKYSLPQHSLHDQFLDSAWISDDEFVICGGDLLQGLHCVEGVVSVTRKYETRDGHNLCKIIFDLRSGLLATASETGTIDIWNPTGQCHSFNAHQGIITSLAWQPLPFTTAVADESERLLASAGEDGAISIWNARSAETKPKSSVTMGSAVLSLAFTPDGAFIAGGTIDRILIWKTGEFSVPRASWLRSDQSGWRTPMSQDSAGDENQYSLSWNVNGHKLAYGGGTSLAVIDFRR